MSMLLIVADREGERQVALSRGLELATKMGWGVQLVGFVYENLDEAVKASGADRQQLKKQLVGKRRAELELELEKHPSDVPVALTVVWEQTIHQWLDNQCERKNYAAVIKTGHRSETFTYTSTDWHLLRECPAPVLIAAEKKWRATKPIVAAIDLSDDSRGNKALNARIIETAKEYAEKLDCKLYLVSALHIPRVLTELDLVDEHSHTKKLKSELTPKIAKLAREYDIPQSSFKLKQGPVDKVITSESARLKAQLVVMGTIGRQGVKGRLLGNTAEKVLNMLRTDVLALKP
ncbi:MAG: universal stress protein [Halieaceae bacterium]|nr:universal stress protein [Halieaceae bacterium]